ncbi:MAG: hypothetical protein V2J20_01670 [Wenzhouxiangella sp.]|jgi:hypothetical protein|nr:hypothetical protein [Wenzhouxiangella sp.]
MAQQAVPKRPSTAEIARSAIIRGGCVAGELLALSSLGLGLISGLVLIASLMP